MSMSQRLWRSRLRDYACTVPVYRYDEDGRGKVVARHFMGWQDLDGSGRAIAFHPRKHTHD